MTAAAAAAASTTAGPAVSSRHGESRRFDIYVFATVVAKFSDNYGLLAAAIAAAAIAAAAAAVNSRTLVVVMASSRSLLWPLQQPQKADHNSREICQEIHHGRSRALQALSLSPGKGDLCYALTHITG